MGEAGRESVLADATVDRYADRLLAICRRALGQSGSGEGHG
jgi:hypothetical protein